MRQCGEATVVGHCRHGLVRLSKLNGSFCTTQIIDIFGEGFAKTAAKKSAESGRADMHFGGRLFNGQIVRKVLVNPMHHAVNSSIGLISVRASR